MSVRAALVARLGAGLIFCQTLLTIGCGAEEERFPSLPEAASLEVTTSQLGVGLHHGDSLGAALNRNGAAFVDVSTVFGHTFFHVKSYDEVAGIVGEFHVQRIRSEQVDFEVRGPMEFPLRSPAARLARRADDIVREFEVAKAIADVDAFGEKSFVVDFWRERGDWFVRWDGNLNTGSNIEGTGTYGFDREEFSEDLLAELVTMAEEHQPTYLIIGDSMDRMLAAEGYEEGVAPEQFEPFLIFFKEAVTEIKSVAPQTQIMAGFHWENVTGRLAAAYHEVEEADLDEALLDEVFETMILPFVEAGDGLAIRSRVARSEMIDWKYQFLRRLEDLYTQSIPVIVYSLSTPISSQAEYPQQRLFVERFAEVMAGVDPAIVVWERLTNIDGVDTGDQSVVGRCQALTNPELRLQMERAKCYDGLLQLYQDKPVMTALKNLKTD